MVRSRTLRVVLAGLFVAQVLASANMDSSYSDSIQCDSVQREFVAGGIGPASLVPSQPIHDADMDICYSGGRDTTKKTCCSRKMERRYLQAGEKDFYEVIRSTSSYLKNLIWTNAAQYQEQFLEMIQTAENHTEQLFEDVYKIPLKDRRGPLENLFMDLQAYIKRREVNIHETVEQFFDELFPLVFHNILSDPSVTDLSEDYRECLMEVRQEMYPRPFGEVPHHLAHQLSRSLITAKTFLEALSLGIETINTTDHLVLEPQCTRALTRLRYCSHCEGYVEARPCRNFCYNVMRGCLATIGEIDRHWNEFVDAVKALTTNMRGPYDIEHVLHGLHSRISEAILHAMETGHKFYAKVVEKCGHPKTTDAETSPGIIGRADVSGEVKKSHGQSRTSLTNKIDTFMRSLLASKGFYRSLADTMCSAEKFATGLDQDHCWNGASLGKYNKTLIEVDVEAQMRDNPEMKVAQRHSPSINILIDKLIHVKKLLNSKVSTEMMQSDDWSKHNTGYYGRKRYRGSKGYYYSGDRAMDDEDYMDFSGGGPNDMDVGSGYEEDRGSGYGYGAYYPRPNGPRRKHKDRRPGYGPDPDIYLEDEKPTRPPPKYPTSKPAAEYVEYGGDNAAPSIQSSLTIFLATLWVLAFWVNG